MDYSKVLLQFGENEVTVNAPDVTTYKIGLSGDGFTLQKLIDSLDKIKDMAIIGVKKD